MKKPEAAARLRQLDLNCNRRHRPGDFSYNIVRQG